MSAAADKRAQLEAELAGIEALPGYRRTDPQYFRDPMIDRLLEIVLLLGGELWAARDRQMLMEQLLAREGRISPDLIETYRPEPELAAELERQRRAFIRRVFSCLYGGELKGDETLHFGWVTQDEGRTAAAQ
jgi:hypothetical protein